MVWHGINDGSWSNDWFNRLTKKQQDAYSAAKKKAGLK